MPESVPFQSPLTGWAEPQLSSIGISTITPRGTSALIGPFERLYHTCTFDPMHPAFTDRQHCGPCALGDTPGSDLVVRRRSDARLMVEGDRYIVLLHCGHWTHTRRPKDEKWRCPFGHGDQLPAVAPDNHTPAVISSLHFHVGEERG